MANQVQQSSLKKRKTVLTEEVPATNPTYAKPVSPCVERLFFHNQLKRVNGGISRLTCVVYRYNRVNHKLWYAAALFKQTDGETIKETYGSLQNLKHLLRETAYKRLNEKPNEAYDIYDTGSILDFHDQVRQLVYYNGPCHKKEAPYEFGPFKYGFPPFIVDKVGCFDSVTGKYLNVKN